VHLTRRRPRAFSLVEVMVTVAVVSIGLLGLAKMAAAAIANTQVSRVRSLVSVQAQSLAAAMRANRAYWASGAAPSSVTISGTTVTDAGHVLDRSADCNATVCTASQLAAFDLQGWAANLDAHFKGYAATVACSTATSAPIACTITLTWTEKIVAINRSTAASGVAQSSTQRYALYVQP